MTWYPKRAAKAQSSVHSGQRGISPAIRRIPEIPAVEPFGGTRISPAFFPRASGADRGGGTGQDRFPGPFPPGVAVLLRTLGERDRQGVAQFSLHLHDAPVERYAGGNRESGHVQESRARPQTAAHRLREGTPPDGKQVPHGGGTAVEPGPMDVPGNYVPHPSPLSPEPLYYYVADTPSGGAVENRFLGIIAEVEKARKGLAIYAALVIVLSAVSFAYSEPILLFLVRLLNRKLVAYDPSEGFFALLPVALYCGLALSLAVGGWER